MATYAKATFNFARYASVRPTYPPKLYNLAFSYHASHPKAHWETAVDLGCGPGFVVSELVPKFEKVVATDPSSGMLDKAREVLGNENDKLRYVQSGAEELPDKIPDLEGKIDLITAGQAAHWFKYPDVYTSLKRLLRPQTGTFVFWGYSEFRFSHWTSLTKLISDYSQGSDPEHSLGPHWERPGRTIVDSRFDAIDMPTEKDGFKDVKRVWFALPHHEAGPGIENNPAMLKKSTTWEGLEEYLRTFSSLHTYHERYSQDKMQKVIGQRGYYGPNEGDIAQRFLGRCQAALRADGVELKDEIAIEWPLSVFMARRQ